jgi:hypothetical protein
MQCFEDDFAPKNGAAFFASSIISTGMEYA